jgi:predicted XRE-type DNA-binding protein
LTRRRRTRTTTKRMIWKMETMKMKQKVWETIPAEMTQEVLLEQNQVAQAVEASEPRPRRMNRSGKLLAMVMTIEDPHRG